VLETTANGELRMRFDPLTVTALRLIRLAEAEFAASTSQPMDFTLANISLGASALSDAAAGNSDHRRLARSLQSTPPAPSPVNCAGVRLGFHSSVRALLE